MIQVSTTDVLAMIRCCFYNNRKKEEETERLTCSRHTAARRHLDSGLFCDNIPNSYTKRPLGQQSVSRVETFSVVL